MSQAEPIDRGAAKRSIDRSPSAGSKDDAVGIAGRIAAIGRRLAELKAEQADLEAARAILELELAEIVARRLWSPVALPRLNCSRVMFGCLI